KEGGHGDLPLRKRLLSDHRNTLWTRCKTLVCALPMWYNESLGKSNVRPQNTLIGSRFVMPYEPQNPLIVQSDRSLLLEVDNTLYEAARDELARFAELEKSPEHIHTYRITPLSLWNAASAGIASTDIFGTLERYTKFDLPRNVLTDIEDYISRFGRVKLVKSDAGELLLRSDDPMLIAEIARNKRVQPCVLAQPDRNTLQIDPKMRGHIKQALVLFGYPAEDLAGYTDGAPLVLALSDRSSRDGE